MPQDTSNVLGIDISKIKNRNERRVAELMPSVLENDFEGFEFDSLDIQDIYALALNLLPAQYAQQGSIIISSRIPDEDIRDSLRQAVDRVLDNPTSSKV